MFVSVLTNITIFYNLSPRWKVKKKLMKISNAAEISGLTIKTVRYYANIGIVKPLKNEQNGYREYSNDDVAKLSHIKSILFRYAFPHSSPHVSSSNATKKYK